MLRQWRETFLLFRTSRLDVDLAAFYSIGILGFFSQG